jgi:1-deoxy-D-xylulose-5-phosphate synthase
VFDPAFLRIIPNMALLAPRDEGELRHMLATAIHANGPVAIRYPRGAGVGADLSGPPTPIPWGKAEVLLDEGDDLLILSAGPMGQIAMQAAHELSKEGVSCSVINARFIKPLDEELLVSRISSSKVVLTIEESSLSGGFGAAVLELSEAKGLRPMIKRLGIPDRFIAHASIPVQRKRCNLDVKSIIEAFRTLADSNRVLSINLCTNADGAP